MSVSIPVARGVRAVAIGVLLGVAPFVFAPAAASAAASPQLRPAAGGCDSLVVDDADVLADKAVRRAALRVQAQAADIRVRTYQQVPGGDLDGFERRQEHRCPSWRSPDGTRKNNLIVLVVDVGDRKTGLYYGEVWTDELDDAWPRIQATAMNPNFHRGDFTAGMAGGLRAVARALAGEPAAAPAPADPVVAVPQTPAPEVAPAGPTSPWTWAVPLLVALAGAGLWGGLLLRRRLNARAAARTGAAEARDVMAAAFLRLDASAKFSTARVAALPAVDDPLLNGLRQDFRACSDRVKTAMDGYLAASEQYPATLLAEADTGTARDATGHMDGLAKELDGLTAEVDAIAVRLDGLDALRTELPAQVHQIRELTDAVEMLLPTRFAEGFHVGFADRQLPEIEAGCADVQRLLDQMRFGAADVEADALLEQAQALVARVQGLPEQQRALRADLEQLRGRVPGLRTALTRALSDTTGLEQEYDATCTGDVRAAVDSGTQHLDELGALLDDLDKASSMDVQDFVAATSTAATAHQVGDGIAEACELPGTRREQLTKLRAELPTTLVGVSAAARRLGSSLDEHADAGRFLDSPIDVVAVTAELDRVAAEVQAARPPWLQLSQQLDRLAGVVRDGQHRLDSVVAAFTATEQVLRRAADAVAAAEDESSRMHAGARSEELAAEAREILDRASAAATLAGRQDLAEQAEARAGQAVQEARRAIGRHQASLQRSGSGFGTGFAAGSAFGSGMGGGGFGGSGGGGFGGGGGGGGSSSFGGGGGGGGGGSSSW